ncbi:MAG TPA: hypothetical protein DCS93_08155 [Microscillaceae bacterium]|nr:hypothetical protein [Microscillaceae bacterium]
MKKSLKTFRDSNTILSYTKMRTVKGGTASTPPCNHETQQGCDEYADVHNTPEGQNGTGTSNQKEHGGVRNDMS